MSEEVFLALCRPGFESDLAAELSDRAVDLGVAGYPRTDRDNGYVLWHSQQGSLMPLLDTGLIFARSLYPCAHAFTELPEADRIGALWPALQQQGPFNELYLEHADTNDGRELARFLRGFRKALEPRLRKGGLLRERAERRLHLFFQDSRNGWLGVSPASLPLPENGVMRLRISPEAPSRPALKLEEAMLRFIGRGRPDGVHTAVDLGAAPGGWTQVAAKLVGSRGTVVASDLLAMDALPDVTFIEGDFREEAVYERIIASLGGRPVDLVMSDMAPNMSGMKDIDQPRIMYLAELALELAQAILRPGACLLVKVFHGEGYEAYMKQLQAGFRSVKSRKPGASRARSREVYLLARGFQRQD